MTIYRRGSVTVEAIKASEVLRLWRENADLLPGWVKDAYDNSRLEFYDTHIQVKTTEGWDTADAKSWIIQRQTEHGELYAIPGKAFEDRYTRVE